MLGEFSSAAPTVAPLAKEGRAGKVANQHLLTANLDSAECNLDA